MRATGARNGGGGRLGAELSAVLEALAASAAHDWPQTPGASLVSITEYAARRGVSTSYVRRQARQGQLNARRVGGRWLVRIDERSA